MKDLLLGCSAQSSLIQLRPELRCWSSTPTPIRCLRLAKSDGFRALAIASDHRGHPFSSVAAAAGSLVPSDSMKMSSSATTVLANCVDSKGGGVESEPETGGGGGDQFGGGSGGGGGGGDDGKEEGEGSNVPDDGKRKMALSMSQKLTLGYAALVGVGGLMGYMKSGSQKSLFAGGLTAAVLYYVYRELPTKPVFASSIGVAMAAALTWVMGTRFMRTRKVFPAGVVSFVSFIMTGGYIHGIMRSAH